MKYEITMDLCKDYSEMVRERMRQRGFQSNKDGHELWYDFFNLDKKSIHPHRRKVVYSREFYCPPELSKGLHLLVQKFESGADVSPHLSKDASDPYEFDGLLYDWGIYHFHLGESIDPRTGRIERTGPILFARVDNKNVYCINIYTHGKGKQPWSNQEMVKIIHQNWPDTIKEHRLPDGTRLYPDTISAPNDAEYAHLRKNGVSTIICLEDGVAYFSPGGGYASSGHSTELVLLCNWINNELKFTEVKIHENIDALAEDIENISGLQCPSKLEFKLVEYMGALYVAETHTKFLIKKLSVR